MVKVKANVRVRDRVIRVSFNPNPNRDRNRNPNPSTFTPMVGPCESGDKGSDGDFECEGSAWKGDEFVS
jgi:hypothetical protein